MNYQLLDTPIGQLRLLSTGTHLAAIEFSNQHSDTEGDTCSPDQVLERCASQLREYFAGRRKTFDLPLAPRGTDFQCCVWRALSDIPWGAVCSYADIARAIGQAQSGKGGGRCQWPQPPAHRGALPPGYRQRRLPHRLCRGAGYEAKLLALEGHWRTARQ